MKREFTATCYIVHKNRLLFLFHKKHQKWLPPGGHVEVNETPSEAAIREVHEETGLCVELIEQENLRIHHHNAISTPRPYLCLIESIPKWQEIEAHEHIDFIYVAKLAGSLLHSSPENHQIRWFGVEDIEKLKVEEEIFQETKESALHILTRFSDLPHKSAQTLLGALKAQEI